MSENAVHLIDCLEGLAKMPEKCANLIIIDPPYFQVKGDFDFVMTFDEWQELHRSLARECKRVMADNGTLFLWGMDRKIAYQQVIFDEVFNLIGTIVWEKPSIASEWDTRRTFPERGQERLLMYSNGTEPEECGNPDEGVEFVFQPILDWFLKEWELSGLTRRKVDEECKTSNVTQYWFSKRNFQIPTYEKYIALRRLAPHAFHRGYEDLRREYEDLRREYEDLRRPFNNFLQLTDVWRFSQEGHVTGKYDHPTVKPEKLTRALILTCSRENDLVLVPFAGSGTECAMAAKENRRFIGFEIEPKYVDIANTRAAQYLNRKQLSILDFTGYDHQKRCAI